MRLFVVSLTLVAFVVRHPSLLASERRVPGQQTMRLGSHGEPLVEVSVNGLSLLMLVDTGSTHTSLTRGAAQRLGLHFVAKSVVSTSTGDVVQPITLVERLELAGVERTGILASVVEDCLLDPSGRIDGVVGQDVLAADAYTLDFGAGVFAWHAPPVADPADLLPLIFVDGRFVATVVHPSGTLRLVLDSGAAGLVLFGRSSERLFRENGETISAITVAGRRSVPLVVVPRLQVAAVTLTNVMAALVPGAHAAAPTVDGLLPLHLFRQVTIDGPGRRLIVTR